MAIRICHWTLKQETKSSPLATSMLETTSAYLHWPAIEVSGSRRLPLALTVSSRLKSRKSVKHKTRAIVVTHIASQREISKTSRQSLKSPGQKAYAFSRRVSVCWPVASRFAEIKLIFSAAPDGILERPQRDRVFIRAQSEHGKLP